MQSSFAVVVSSRRDIGFDRRNRGILGANVTLFLFEKEFRPQRFLATSNVPCHPQIRR
ncbi:hypothetical protein [Baaleninema sp.]|uniref:hypothetical protein n=1 Tax=Baaleninema sp. TaxID=3101197 RepID=UPI003D00B4F7